MASTVAKFSFKEVLSALPRGKPLSVKALRQYGLTKFHPSWLVRHDWLQRLGRDAYLLPGDELTRAGALSYLASRIPGLHVGSDTALAWRGVRHNIAFRDQISLWGDKPARLPTWFTDKFVAHYQVTTIFKEKMPKQLGLQSLPNGRPEVLVSVPERALLELLSDVGKRQSLEEATHLVEGLRTLRAPVLDELLGYTTRIKVARLADQLAQRADLPWANIARRHSARLGGGERWLAVSSSGERIDLRRK